MKTLNITKEELKQLYDRDYPLWVDINLQLLKEKEYELVDWENLLEEIEDMGRSDLKACVSYLAVILEHLYKLDNFKDLAGGEKAGNSWVRSIKNARYDINRMFNRYPSLKVKLPQELQYAWEEAVSRLRKWLSENDIDPDTYNFPKDCPYTYEEALSKDLR
ncbi:MAG: DUF29 domain-containing protein [Sulfurihydrogenibium sp.]|nr:MAG: DUF29 domain-containing protein [Sulfurihydrogenibium sp.]